MKNLFCKKAINLPFDLIRLNMGILCCRLSFCFVILGASIYPFFKTEAIKSKILDTAFYSFDSFNNNKIKRKLCKEELKVLHNLRKQKHLVILKSEHKFVHFLHNESPLSHFYINIYKIGIKSS